MKCSLTFFHVYMYTYAMFYQNIPCESRVMTIFTKAGAYLTGMRKHFDKLETKVSNTNATFLQFSYYGLT